MGNPGGKRGDSLRVLIVEDDEDDYVLMRAMLQEFHGKEYQIGWLSTYQGFDQALERDRWDVILIDYDLGGQNGLNLIRGAVEKGTKTPFIMVTGRGRDGLELEARDVGAADYLTKNMLDAALLEQTIRSAVERVNS